jgi:hypothetical protein
LSRVFSEEHGMPTVLRQLPFFEHSTSLTIPGKPGIEIKHHQIIVWVSITKVETAELPSTAGRFPAVLDTGFNDNFLIREEQLIDWAALTPQQLPAVDFLLVGQGQHVPLREAVVWLHPNRPGFRDDFTKDGPFCLELDTGIGVWPARLPGARRLPLLGVRGLQQTNLELILDCRKCQVSLRTPRRFWFFG